MRFEVKCPRCNGTGIEREPSDKDMERAIELDSLPVACYYCGGSGAKIRDTHH